MTVRRFSSHDVLESVAGHRLVDPIRHGARVETLVDDFEQGRLVERG